MKKKFLSLTLAAGLLATAVIGGTLAYFTDTEQATNTFTVGKIDIILDEAKVDNEGNPINNNGPISKDGDDFTYEELQSADRVDNNNYKLFAGHYTKDPTVTIDKNSENCYVWMEVKVAFEETLTNDDIEILRKNGEDTNLVLENYIITGYETEEDGTGRYWERQGNPETTNNTTIGEGNNKKTYATVLTYKYLYVGLGRTSEGAVNVSTAEADQVTDTVRGDIQLAPLFTGITIPDNWDNKHYEAIGNFDIYVKAYAAQAHGFNSADAAWNSVTNNGGFNEWSATTTDTSTNPPSGGDEDTDSDPVA